MSAPSQINSIKVEIHRFGGESGLIKPGERYIVLTGNNAPASEQMMRLEHADFLGRLNCLRYPQRVTNQQVTDALNELGEYAADFLPSLAKAPPDRLIQVDLVLGAAELWAFPFEACRINGVRVFADPSSNFILTRRIRRDYDGHKRPWPVRPRVLFAHALSATDLPESLIQSHTEALEDALVPWSSTGEPQRDGLLQVELVLGERDLRKALEKAYETESPFTHIHILAHGKKIVDPNPLNPRQRWGLRLGDQQRDATDPEGLAKVLSPRDGLPIVVTVASCDSANQAETTIPERSFAQELHNAGVPMVLASQLPLTPAGSVIMTRTCYQLLLRGEDARWALHKARLELVERGDIGQHDWVSLVGYVELPEGYADQLMEVGLKLEMALLRAARKRLERMSEHEEHAAHLNKIENELQDHIVSLEKRLREIPEGRKDLRDECQGILASAHKRLAELSFRRAARAVARTEKDIHLKASRMSLEASLENYRATFRSNIHHHWSGAQQLALEAALHGAFDERDWDTTFRAAELHIANDDKEYWACGTVAELWLLAPLLGKSRNLEQAKKALDAFKARAVADPDAVLATRDQLNRYVSWWTTANGFFGDHPDLATDAQDLLSHLMKP